MNCVHVISGDLWAGAELATFNVVCELSRRAGVAVKVVALNEGTLTDRLRACGVPTHVFVENGAGFWRLLRQCTSWASQERIDVLHSHRYKENLLAAALSAVSGAFHVRTAHGLPPTLGTAPGPAGFASLLDDAIGDWVGSTWIAVSNDLARRRAGLRRSVHVVPNGLPLEAPAADRSLLDSAFAEQESALYVGFVGRLEPVKRPDRFLRVLAALPRRVAGRAVRGVVVGDGSLARALRSAGDPNVRFLGHRDNADAIVGALDLLVIPSDHEGHPMVLLEAMRAGVPVVATSVGGMAEMLGAHPWLTAPGDERALVRASVTLLADAGLRLAWGRQLHGLFAERFAIESTVDRLLAIYSRGAGARTRSRG